MARVNINILGISELKWKWMGKFNSVDHCIYYCAQESLRWNGVALIVTKSPKCSTWVQSQKWQNDLGSFSRQTIQYHGNPCLCPNHWCQKCWGWMVLWRPTRPSGTNMKKSCPFHHRGLECKSRKSRNTWSNKLIWPWSMEWSRAKANRVLPREHIGHSKHPLPTTRDDSTNGHQQTDNTKLWLIIFFAV